MDDHIQQSLQLWPLLVLAARSRQTLTYIEEARRKAEAEEATAEEAAA